MLKKHLKILSTDNAMGDYTNKSIDDPLYTSVLTYELKRAEDGLQAVAEQNTFMGRNMRLVGKGLRQAELQRMEELISTAYTLGSEVLTEEKLDDLLQRVEQLDYRLEQRPVQKEPVKPVRRELLRGMVEFYQQIFSQPEADTFEEACCKQFNTADILRQELAAIGSLEAAYLRAVAEATPHLAKKRVHETGIAVGEYMREQMVVDVFGV